MTARSDLLERLTKTTGPDRELDALLHAFADGRTVRENVHPEFGRQLLARNSRPPHDEYWLDHPASMHPAFTGSIDAAHGLVTHFLPGHQVNMHTYGNPVAEASIGARIHAKPAEAPTLPIAILIALMTALGDQP